jgi:hypothetical protein
LQESIDGPRACPLTVRHGFPMHAQNYEILVPSGRLGG